MNRHEKVEFLNGVKSGKRICEEIVTESIHYDRLTDLELERLYTNLKQHGCDSDKWPVEENIWFDQVYSELPNRLPWSYFTANELNQNEQK